jgi:cation transport ATPase
MDAPKLIQSRQADTPGLLERETSLNGTASRRGGSENSEHGGVEWIELLRIVFVACAAACVWFRIWEPLPRVSVIGVAATLIGGYPIFKEAFENIVERKMTMELSMTIALLSALAIGEFFTALVITAFVLAAEILEGLRSRKPNGYANCARRAEKWQWSETASTTLPLW